MYKKEIKYVDFNGTERVEDFYFHLSVPEVTRMQAKFGGQGMETYAKNLSANNDESGMINFIEELVLNAYGKKSPDGKSFIKNPEIRKEFEYSQAYAELFEELLTNQDETERFSTGIATQTKQMNQPAMAVVPTNR